MSEQSALSWKIRIGYGSGDFGLNLFWQGAGFFLFFFYTDVIGLPNAVAGTIFALGGIWDAVTDPVMGYLAERTRSRWGSYRPYILVGLLPLAATFVLLFSVPAGVSENYIAGMVLLALLGFRTAYTVVSIPYSTFGARLTSDSDERTRLAGIRMYCGFLGGISVIAAARFLQARFADETAFQYMAAFCALLGVAVLLLCLLGTRNAPTTHWTAQPATSLFTLLASLGKNLPFLLILGGIIGVTVATTIIGKTILYFFEYDLGDRLAGNTAILIMMGAPLITIPLWSAIALRAGKRPAWLIGCLITLSGLACLFFDHSGSTNRALFDYALITLGLSSFSVLFWSMMPDTIEHGEYRTGVRNEAVIIGVVSSAQKVSLALSAFVLGVLLDVIGYDAGVEQSMQTLEGLRQIITLIPAGAIAAALALIAFYPISTASHGKIIEALRARRTDSGRSR